MKHGLLSIVVYLSMALSSCEMAPSAAPDAGSARAWFDAPLPGTVIVPPNPCQIVAHGASPGGISAFELSINGAASSIPSPDTKNSLVTLTRDCGLTEPGTYQLRLRTQDNAGVWSDYAETSLIIEAPGTTTAPAATGSPASTRGETPTPTPVAVGDVMVQSVSTDLVYVGDRSCGPLEVTIAAHATAPKGIAVVVLFYRFEPGSPSGFQDVAMNPTGNDLYQITLNPTALLGSSPSSDQATLQYQVVVQQKDGDTSIRTPVMADVAVEPCGSAAVDCPDYSSQRVCEAHGCNWVQEPGLVPVYVCKNP